MDQRKFVNRCTMKRRPSNFASSSTAPFIPTYFRLLNGEGESIGPRVNNVEVGRFSTSVEGFFFLPFDFIPDPSFFRLKNFPRSFQGKIWRRISNDVCIYMQSESIYFSLVAYFYEFRSFHGIAKRSGTVKDFEGCAF